MTLFRMIPMGDLELSELDPETGKRSIFTLTGAEYVRQKLSTRFKFFLGEWFLDRREGVPYYRDVFVKNPDLDVIRSVFRDIVRSVVEVGSITRFDLVYTPAARTLAFDFEIKLVDGSIIVVRPTDDLFIINVQQR